MVPSFITERQKKIQKKFKKTKFFYVTLVGNMNTELQMSQEQFVFHHQKKI